LFGLSWRPIFLINVPIGLVALLGAARLVRESAGRSARGLRLDVGGVVLATAGLVLLLYPLVQGRQLGWPAWTFAAMAASIAVFACFARYERDPARQAPLVSICLFAERSFVGGLLVALTLFGGMVGFFVVYAVFVQQALGLSPLQAGLTALVWPL